MSRGPKETFSQRRHTESQQTQEKMLNVTNHQGNTSKNYNEISQTSENGSSQNYKL